ncbi:unnamed protein product [Linum tenue]|uniref:Tify domain-containing protein n=1 Tax=Linum tenue TaxID=586396 RepID=A0AAV0PW34_9ROSI|nr:unnamed protein product [Linum tenue]
MDEGLWLRKDADRDLSFNSSSSRVEPNKRTHQWFIDGAELDLYPYKKQAMESSNAIMPGSEIPSGGPSAWDHHSTNFQSDQFVHQLFQSEAAGSDSFSERIVSSGDPEACISSGGLRTVKVDQVKDENNVYQDQKQLGSPAENVTSISENQEVDNAGSESHFILMEQGSHKEEVNVLLIGETYNGGEEVRAETINTATNYVEGVNNVGTTNICSDKGDGNVILFNGLHDVHDTVGQPPSSYEQPYNVSLAHTPELVHKSEFDASNSSAAAKSKPQSSRNKLELKTSRKEAPPNSFPSNVRSLLSTGMLDGVPVMYVASSREVIRAVVKGTGYLCGCQSCNYSKVLNAYEFERHAGCKTKHPNNHIYFDNGKTIYQIVQELRSTPESKLFDVIQTVFGAPINQKSFKIWKESFQAATRELQRIYGKEELNL